MTRVVPPDMEAWLVAYLRDALIVDGLDVEVDNKEPSALVTPLEVPLVVVRDDSGARQSPVSFGRQVGVSVLAGSRQDDEVARQLAGVVFSVLTDDAVCVAAGSPVAAVVDAECRGPYRVDDDQDVARLYMTLGFVAVGSW